ncbi:MAG TPA: lamin tail domain-containing protein [Myxococcota bacterium]|nr:lamin tail domain-containing protein [Myxococcota bacterium]
MKHLSILTVALAACAPQPQGDDLDRLVGFDAPRLEDGRDVEALPGQVAPPVQALTLTVDPHVAGQPVRWRIEGLNPGERVTLARGMGGLGSGPCLSALGGLCLGIRSPIFVVQTLTANAAGVAEMTFTMPSTIPVGTRVAYQAAAIRGPNGADTVYSNAVGRQFVGGAVGMDQVSPGDLVLTEVMTNPNVVADSSGEWVELQNTSANAIDLDGLELSDDGGDSFVVTGSEIVGPGDFFVMGRDANAMNNGGVAIDAAYGTSFSLANTVDEVVLSYAGVELDRVAYGLGWPLGVGKSTTLDPLSYDVDANDLIMHWCDATTPYGPGDRGTPGRANDDCADPGGTCRDGQLNQDEEEIDCGGVCAPCSGYSFQTNEDFETGDLTLFPWQVAGPNPFVVETNAAACHGGQYCLRTSPLHAPSEVASAQVALSVRQDTVVSFWMKTNLEPNEHYIRFYVDGSLEAEITSQLGWTRYTVDVPGTGPNGPNRVLKWEYTRSAFIDPGHAPYNQVWIDDIDMPDWNTQPTIPALLAPADGLATTDTTPTLQVQSTDPDGDPITYELQWSNDAAFASATSSGEINTTSYTPTLAPGIYYWRARSKDNSDRRWSAWSTFGTFEVDTGLPQPGVWKQTSAAAFGMNTFTGNLTRTDTISSQATALYDSGYTGWVNGPAVDGWEVSIPMTGLPTAATAAAGTVYLDIQGDLDNSSTLEQAFGYIDGTVFASNWNPNATCSVAQTGAFTVANIGGMVNDGSATFRIDTEGDVNPCSGNAHRARVRLTYNRVGTSGTMTTPPIAFTTLTGATLWDKVQWRGSGATRVQILDAAGALLPDTVVPGNAAGITAKEIHLFQVDPVSYPSIRLRATLDGTSALEEWRVVGGTSYVWDFNYNDGETGGWAGYDTGAQATVTVSGGVLRFAGLAAGTDPSLQLSLLPSHLLAEDFDTITFRVRTSNNGIDDDPTLFWQSNYGGFDVRRSFAQTIYLWQWQDVTYDLHQSVTSPNEPWQGNIEIVRFDPVQRFLNAALAPVDGWFEIDRVELR